MPVNRGRNVQVVLAVVALCALSLMSMLMHIGQGCNSNLPSYGGPMGGQQKNAPYSSDVKRAADATNEANGEAQFLVHAVIGGVPSLNRDSDSTNDKAVVTFVDYNHEMHGSMYGVYSIRQRLRETHMLDVDQLALIPFDFPQPEAELLVEWLGDKNVRRVNTTDVLPHSSSELWRGVFNKMVVFNLTEYARIFLLDNDVLIRTNIQHWFEYPTPCATQDRGTIEWNSGVMCITPSTLLFDTLVRNIPRSRRWADATYDTWNSGHGQQGFLSAFFTSNLTLETMYTMPFQNAILSSALRDKKNKYFVRHRPTLIETVHFTTDKPWRSKTHPQDREVCQMLLEWNRSLHTLPPNDVLTPLPMFTSNC